jgi:hypothetical protein
MRFMAIELSKARFLSNHHPYMGEKYMNHLLRAALDYSELGWKIAPNYEPKDQGCSCTQGRDCTTAGKHPRIAGGFHEASSDKEQIVQWWEQWPDANIGINPYRSGLVILDIDERNGGVKSFTRLTQQQGDLPETLKVYRKSAGIVHYYFLLPYYFPKKAHLVIDEGIELIINKQIIAPPSMHYTNEPYMWVNRFDIWSVCTLPEWIIDGTLQKIYDSNQYFIYTNILINK